LSYVAPSGGWCNIIVLNVNATSEQESDDSNDNFFEGFDHFPKYHMKTSLGDFNAKLLSGDIFKLTIGNESLHQDSKDNGVRIINFAT
jgi:hypothetical protein